MRINFFTLFLAAALIAPTKSNASDIHISCEGDVYTWNDIFYEKKLLERKKKSYSIKNGEVNGCWKNIVSNDFQIICIAETKKNNLESFVWMIILDREEGTITETFVDIKDTEYFKTNNTILYQSLTALQKKEVRVITEFSGQCKKANKNKPKF